MTIQRLSQFLLNLSYADLMRLLGSDWMNEWPRDAGFYVYLTQRLFPNPDRTTADSLPEMCEPCDEQIAKRHLSQLMHLLDTTSLEDWQGDDVPAFSFLDRHFKDRVNDWPSELRAWADAAETRQRFVAVVRELLRRNGTTFCALLLIAEQGSRWPDLYYVDPVNALAAISCHVNVGAPVPASEMLLLRMMQRYSLVPHLRHNAEGCVAFMIDRFPELGEIDRSV